MTSTGTTAHGLIASDVSADAAAHTVRTVLTGTPQPPGPESPIDQWCIAELTDGRLTGIHTLTGWWLSIDEYPDLGPARLAADATDWWRLRLLRVFSPDSETIITADESTLTATRLADMPIPGPAATRPRDRGLLISDGTTTPPTTGPAAIPRPGIQLGDRFVAVTTTSHRTSVVPGPLSVAHGVWHTRLHVREYFSQDPDTGMVGVMTTRYLAIQPTLTRP